MATVYDDLVAQYGGTVDQETASPSDYSSLVEQYGGSVEEPKPKTTGEILADKIRTSPSGLVGATIRGAALPAAGAAAGAAMGAPLAGVGAIPGAIAGAGAAVMTQLVGDPVIDAINEKLGTHYTRPSDAMSHWLSSVGVPEPRTAAERIVEQTVAGAAGAGGTAAAGRAIETAAGAAKPVLQGVGRTLAAQPVTQIAGGAGAGAAGQAAAEAGLPVPAQVAASIAGGAVSAGAASRAMAGKVPKTPLPQAVQDAEDAGMIVMTSDVFAPRSPIGKWLQTRGERIPWAGTAGKRIASQERRISAVSDLLVDYGVGHTTGLADDIARNLTLKREALIKRYWNLKYGVLMNVTRKSARQGLGGPRPWRTIAATQRAIDRLVETGDDTLKPAIDRLRNWQKAVQGKDLMTIEDLRAQLGESFKAQELAGVRTLAEKQLSSIYSALREDMADFIKANGDPGDYQKWVASNKKLSGMVDELEMTSLKRALDKAEIIPEGAIEPMLFSKKPSELKKLYDGLTPTGRSAARIAILTRVAEKAYAIAPGGTATVSPEKFVAALRQYGPSINVFFPPDEMTRVDGLVRAINLTRRSGVAGLFPATGVQLDPTLFFTVLFDVFGGGGKGIAAAGTMGMIARVYESRPVRNLLLQIHRAKPGSQEEAKLAKRLLSAVYTEESRRREESPKSPRPSPSAPAP